MTTIVDGTTGVTFPAGGVGNPASAVVGLTDTQTLTNKTLTSPTLTTPNIDSAQIATVSGTAPIYMCRAWVNFNGTGTVAIRSSGNVTSITDNGTGDYTVNFTTAMSDINYSIVLTSGYTTNGANPSFGVSSRIGTTGNESAPTTSSFRMCIDDTTGNVTDSKYVNVAVFR